MSCMMSRESRGPRRTASAEPWRDRRQHRARLKEAEESRRERRPVGTEERQTPVESKSSTTATQASWARLVNEVSAVIKEKLQLETIKLTIRSRDPRKFPLKQLEHHIQVWSEDELLPSVLEISRVTDEPLWLPANRSKGQLLWSAPGGEVYSDEINQGFLGMALASAICTLQQKVILPHEDTACAG
eukprot:4818286-Amphidinium_carterae.3